MTAALGPSLHDGMEHDLDRAGFTLAEREAFCAAIDKPAADRTEAEDALLLRYEAVGPWGKAA